MILLNRDDNKHVGPELTFTLYIITPPTATPTTTPTVVVVPPTTAPTVTPTASPTPEPSPTSDQPVTFAWTILECEYVGSDWRCRVQLTPYGGGGGPYTLWVFDADQPAEYRGTGQFYHFAKARRCATYNHEIKVQDDATGTSQSQQLYLDPNNYFSGGCTLP